MRLPNFLNNCLSPTSLFFKIFKLAWWDYTDCKCCIFWRGVIFGFLVGLMLGVALWQ